MLPNNKKYIYHNLTLEVSGLVFRELNAADTAYINPGVDCIRWYNENYEDKKHINYMANLMPECPCDITLSRYDPWFWRIGLYRWRYDLTHKCVDMLLIGHDWQHGKVKINKIHMKFCFLNGTLLRSNRLK
jgi:hypothetical protein